MDSYKMSAETQILVNKPFQQVFLCIFAPARNGRYPFFMLKRQK